MNNAEITKLEALIKVTQENWGKGIVTIGQTPPTETEEVTHQLLNDLYVFGNGQKKILFKPTLAKVVPFRTNFEETSSYFIGGIIPEDTGFALRPWEKVTFHYEKGKFYWQSTEDGVDVMGEYTFTEIEDSGKEKDTLVQYTFGYKTIDGELKIRLHHSSLPA